MYVNFCISLNSEAILPVDIGIDCSWSESTDSVLKPQSFPRELGLETLVEFAW